MTASIFVICRQVLFCVVSRCRRVRVLQRLPASPYAALPNHIPLLRVGRPVPALIAPLNHGFPQCETASLYRPRQFRGNRNYLSCLSGFVIESGWGLGCTRRSRARAAWNKGARGLRLIQDIKEVQRE